jgi:hypothetical protein
VTTSGTSAFNPAITQMITAMFRKIGAIAEDETPTAGMYNDALLAGNALIKEWQALGIHVWTEEEAILFFQAGQNRYLLGGANSQGVQGPYGPDNCCDANSWVPMQVASPVSAGATSVTVNTTVASNGIAVANGNYFGIVLDSGVAFWTTVNGTPVNNVITLTNAIPAGATASAQNNAFAYATKIVRPLKIPRARQIYYQGGQSGPRLTPMTVLSRKEYMDLPNPLDPGISTQFFYTPQLVSGEFYPWPNPQNANFGARLTWYRPLMDLTTPANTADLPQEWLNGLMWGIAKEMAPEFDCPPPRFAIISQMAAEKLDLIQSYDRESEPIYFGMSFDEAAR